MRVLPVVLMVLAVAKGGAEDRFYLGTLAGIATLSADARFEVPREAAASGYKPENGLSVAPFFGAYLTDYLALQATYVWNRNDVRYTSLRGAAFSDQPRGPPISR